MVSFVVNDGPEAVGQKVGQSLDAGMGGSRDTTLTPTVLHGGQLDAAMERFGGDREKWLDLSTGINPNTYPVGEISPGAWHDLPDAAAWNNAASAVRKACEADDDAPVSLAPGSQAHLQILPFLFKPQTVAVVGFTYQEHGVCWQRAGHEVFVTDGLESAEATARVVIVVNPNNPDGRIFDPQDLVSLARRLGAKGGLLVVDEAFGDVSPRASVAHEAGRPGLLVMRSLGKFYGLAGVRFGAVLSNDLLVKRLEDRLGPWAVSGPALELATRALKDKKWQEKARKRLGDMREAMEELLIRMGLEIVGGTGLFVLARHSRAEALYEHLGNKRILVRRFPGKPEWLRFGMPAGKPVLNKLDKALSAF